VIYPTIYEESTPRAIKEHKCCECGSMITVGTFYSLIKGLWEGSWDTYKTCEKCHYLRQEAMVRSREMDYDYDYPTLGGLNDWIAEYECDTGEKFEYNL